MMVPQVQLRAYQSGSSTSPLCAPPVESGSCCECCSIFRGIGALGGGVWVLGGGMMIDARVAAVDGENSLLNTTAELQPQLEL